jgi:ribA/ribD-fused uncharacterized protein
MKPVTAFQGEYRFLSNFWPCVIQWEGLVYPTLEHAYAASKTNDPSIKIQIQACATPGDAKEYLAQHHLQADDTWTRERKLDVMEKLLLTKFSGQDPLLTRALMATGDAALIEGNDWDDRFWGVCNGEGENQLGKLLMGVREQLFHEKALLEKYVATVGTHQALADKAGLSRSALYQKMIAFGISQSKFLGYV